jgi:hypothetical protein
MSQEIAESGKQTANQTGLTPSKQRVIANLAAITAELRR